MTEKNISRDFLSKNHGMLFPRFSTGTNYNGPRQAIRQTSMTTHSWQRLKIPQVNWRKSIKSPWKCGSFFRGKTWHYIIAFLRIERSFKNTAARKNLLHKPSCWFRKWIMGVFIPNVIKCSHFTSFKQKNHSKDCVGYLCNCLQSMGILIYFRRRFMSAPYMRGKVKWNRSALARNI